MVLNCRAKSDLDSYMIVSHEWGHFCDSLDNKKIIQAPFCGDEDCEDKIDQTLFMCPMLSKKPGLWQVGLSLEYLRL